MNRRTFLSKSLGILGAVSAASLSLECQHTRTRPNIVFIMTDQQSAFMMSCAGNPWLHTPAMDRLASEGMRFENAYAANPVCVPSRFSLQTGLYPSEIGMRHNGSEVDSERLNPLVADSMGHLFRIAGYHTIYGGKVHLPEAGGSPESWGYEYLIENERDELATECAHFLEQQDGQDNPFFLFVSLINPHDICYHALRDFEPHGGRQRTEPEPLNWALERPDNMSEQEFFQDVCPPLPPNHQPTQNETSGIKQLLEMRPFRQWIRTNWDDRDWRLHRWAYHRLTERVDRQIEIVLQALDRSGLAEDTLVVFTSDHGDMDASHKLEHKTVFYQESIHVPLIIRYPGVTEPGSVNAEHLVCNGLDLLPTLCDVAGIDCPADRSGLTLLPLLKQESFGQWRKTLVLENQVGFMITDGRFKYWLDEKGDHREMLIDLANDPGEMINLAGRVEIADIQKELRERLLTDLNRRGIQLVI
jgi:arylsulfatase A-like enzyme